jgi:hypothetical protein
MGYDNFETWANCNNVSGVWGLKNLKNYANIKVYRTGVENTCNRCKRRIPKLLLRGKINYRTYCLDCFEHRLITIRASTENLLLILNSIDNSIKAAIPRLTQKAMADSQKRMRNMEILTNL